MSKKRFTYDSKQVAIFKDGELWLDGQIDTACNHKEICGLLNELHEENINLHIQNDFLKDEHQHMRDLVNENKQLKEEVKEYKEAMKRMMIDMMGG